MHALFSLYDGIVNRLEAAAPAIIPTLARIVFAGTLFVYFWNSGLTKLGDGLLQPHMNAYFQILPRAMEAAGFDISNLGPFATVIVLLGTWTEFLLPVLLLAGLFTRIAAFGMIIFIFVQTWVDIFGHGVDATTIGTWFNNTSGDTIVDQRAFWVFLLLVLVMRGGGPLSLDALFNRYKSADLTPSSQPR